MTLTASREHVLHLLAEASELEHNLLCSYLFACFSLKQHADEGLTADEHAAVQRWREKLMGVCVQEMLHLAQVANLMAALGARPHFSRPNLPVAPGYHPAGVVVELAPFSLGTLQHFLFLERSEDKQVADAPAVVSDEPRPARAPTHDVLMPSAPDYATIGEFYDILLHTLEATCAALGEGQVFVGGRDTQLQPDEIRSPELMVVTNLETARAAIRLIVAQGEGGPGQGEDSHFATFDTMKREYDALLRARPQFEPARSVVANPLMRAPIAEGRHQITAPEARSVLDACNAVYAVMLRALTLLFDTPWSDQSARQALLGMMFGAMQVLGRLAEALTRMPAHEPTEGMTAGMSFTMLRATEGLAATPGSLALLRERIGDIRDRIAQLPLPANARREACGLVEKMLQA